ncbi:MAG: hypothetical protein KBC98_02400 [Candidatus Pacebacteria bacterium]|nr:hypothetical protein [Candidatus Paceibacterota bacterium]
MNKFWKQIQTDIETISMTGEERARIRSSLQSYMLKHPASIQSPFWSTFFMRPALAGLAGLVILLGSGAGISSASQESLPNESLYPIKIFREELVSLTKTTPREKADYGIVRVEKRLQEATVLAKTNKLEPELKQKIADNISKHVEEVETQTRVVEKISPEIALETTARLETSLETSVKALEALTAPSDKSDDPILVLVETKAEDARATKTETEVLVQENPSEDIRIKAEQKLTDIKTEIEHLGIVSIEPITPPVTTEEKAEEPTQEISVEKPIENTVDVKPVDETINENPQKDGSRDTSTSLSFSSNMRGVDLEVSEKQEMNEGVISEKGEGEIISVAEVSVVVPTPEVKPVEPTRDIFLAELQSLYAKAEASFALGNYGDALVALQSIEQMIASQKTISTLEQTYEVQIPEQLIEVPALSILEETALEGPTDSEGQTQTASVSEAISEIKNEKLTPSI